MSSLAPEAEIDVERRPQALAAILVGGGIVGVLDLASAVFAWMPRGATPFLIMQSVARGLYGKQAYQGGWPTALVGLGCHFLIAFTAAAVFYLASRKLRFLTERPVLSGLLYAEVVYLFMNFAVIPLSAIGEFPTLSWQHLVTGPVGHLFFVGLPISLAVHRFAPLRRDGASDAIALAGRGYSIRPSRRSRRR
jgi:hypothetical protein